MCNACGFYCCGSDEFEGCGCDQCPCSACWPEVDEEEAEDGDCGCCPPGEGHNAPLSARS